jgi:peptide/nickel transport system ATP-binding protein/oligopeptide transport system ATP-binding protein
MPPLLSIEGLDVRYKSPRGDVRAVDGLDLTIEAGETYALVGESGCGKTATAYSILRLVEPGRIAGGRIVFQGRDLMTLTEKQMRGVRGAGIGLAFQEPGAALNPVLKIGTQVGESLRIHRGASRKEAWREAVRLLQAVALPDPERQASSYAHELSGGMKQRAMLAIALSCAPALLIADEPTSALDVTIQAQILDLLRKLKAEYNLTVLLITHDFGVVAEVADRVGVMYAGRLVEAAGTRALFADPKHPYTQALMRAMPDDGDDNRGKRLTALPGSAPDPVTPPSGCRFHPRCPEVFGPCAGTEPRLSALPGERRVACHLFTQDRR